MKFRALLALHLLLAPTSALQAAEWAAKMFETTSHDFGGVARGSKVEFHFVFTNIYEEDVHVAAVRSSCGCTSVEVTKRDLKTWEKAAVVANFNTRSFLGQRSATLTVTIDKPFYAEVQLRVEGYIRSDIVLHPEGIDFGNLPQGTPAERSIDISYAGRTDWEILEVKSSLPFLETNLVETRRGDGLVAYQLLARLREDAPAGYLVDEILLTTNDRRLIQFPVSVQGRVMSAVSVSPASLHLGVVAPGHEVSKKLVVKGQTPFRILRIECDDPDFHFEVADAARPLHVVPVTFTASSQSGKVHREIRITTDLDQQAVATCTVSAHVAKTKP